MTNVLNNANNRLPVLIEHAGVFLVGVLFAYAVQDIAGGLFGVDGYYHIRMASEYANGTVQAAGEHFHWMRHSILNGNFADKDYLWHILLTPFAMIAGDDVSSLEHAAMWAVALMGGLIALTSFRIFRTHGVALPALWVLLLLAISETFIYRLCMCRSHVLSMLLALLGWHLIATGRHRLLVIVGALYALGYTAPHILLMLAGIWWVMEVCAPGSPVAGIWRRLVRPLKPMGWAALGIAIGIALHPHALNMLRLWLVQTLAVPLHSWGLNEFANVAADLAGYRVDTVSVTNIGLEMGESTGRELLSSHAIGILLLIVPWMLASAFGVRPTRRDMFAYLCAFFFFALMLASERFAEYFFPFIVLAGGGLVSRALASEWGTALIARRIGTVGLAGAVVLVFVNLFARPAHLIDLIGERDRENFRDLSEAIDAHVPEGEAVFHADWHLFSHLFFGSPRHDYVVGLDPTFLALHSPELYRMMIEMRSGQEAPAGVKASYDTLIRERFGMRYAIVVPKNHEGFARMMARADVRGDAKLLATASNRRWLLYRLETQKP